MTVLSLSFRGKEFRQKIVVQDNLPIVRSNLGREVEWMSGYLRGSRDPSSKEPWFQMELCLLIFIPVGKWRFLVSGEVGCLLSPRSRPPKSFVSSSGSHTFHRGREEGDDFQTSVEGKVGCSPLSVYSVS